MLAGILSACVVGTASVLSLTGAASDKVYGDANLDGSVDMSDCVLVMQSLANPSKFGTTGTDERHLTADGADLADVSDRGNGITANDALSIQRYLLGTIKSLPESFADGKGSDTSSKDEVNTKIHLKDNAITVDGQYAKADGSKVTISHSGSYTIDGTLSDGQIYVEIPDAEADKGTVKLIFSGVNITGKSAPAVFVKNADKTSITIADGTENVISDGTDAYTGDNEGNAVIEAKDDLTIKGGDKGTGVLTITANTQTAVVCNNDIKFTGGITNIETLNTELANDAVKGKSSVTVKGGRLVIKSEGDGIKSTKGNVDLSGGEVVIKCGNDAVQAETAINISGGDISAFGDKGLTSAGTISITGGELIATATDCQCENLTSTEQNTLMFDFVKEWGKNNPVALTDSSNKELFDKNTSKKFRYAIVSSSKIEGAEYKLFVGGIKMKHSAGSTFKAGKPASYKEVNNDMENEEQLYSEHFSQDMIHKIDVKMDEAQWDNLIANASKEEWTPCDVVIDGEELKNVGIRTKGNSSLMMAKNGKYSFRFRRAAGVERCSQIVVRQREHFGGKERRVLSAVDGDRGDRDAARHHHGRQKGVHTVKRGAAAWHSDDRERGVCGYRSRQVGSHAGEGDYNAEAFAPCRQRPVSRLGRCAVRRINMRLVRDTKLLQYRGSLLHYRQVAVASHDKSYFFHQSLRVLLLIYKIRLSSIPSFFCCPLLPSNGWHGRAPAAARRPETSPGIRISRTRYRCFPCGPFPYTTGLSRPQRQAP